jgi:hypothetical protein
MAEPDRAALLIGLESLIAVFDTLEREARERQEATPVDPS